MRLGARAKTRVTYGAKRRPIAITKARIRIMTDVCMASIKLIQHHDSSRIPSMD